MKDLQDPTITLMVYEPVNEQAYDEPCKQPEEKHNGINRETACGL